MAKNGERVPPSAGTDYFFNGFVTMFDFKLYRKISSALLNCRISACIMMPKKTSNLPSQLSVCTLFYYWYEYNGVLEVKCVEVTPDYSWLRIQQ